MVAIMDPEERAPVPVFRAVYEAIERVRSSGLCNLLDRSCVLATLKAWDEDEAWGWIKGNKDSYARIVFFGMSPIDEDIACFDCGNTAQPNDPLHRCEVDRDGPVERYFCGDCLNRAKPTGVVVVKPNAAVYAPER